MPPWWPPDAPARPRSAVAAHTLRRWLVAAIPVAVLAGLTLAGAASSALYRVLALPTYYLAQLLLIAYPFCVLGGVSPLRAVNTPLIRSMAPLAALVALLELLLRGLHRPISFAAGNTVIATLGLVGIPIVFHQRRAAALRGGAQADGDRAEQAVGLGPITALLFPPSHDRPRPIVGRASRSQRSEEPVEGRTLAGWVAGFSVLLNVVVVWCSYLGAAESRYWVFLYSMLVPQVCAVPLLPSLRPPTLTHAPVHLQAFVVTVDSERRLRFSFPYLCFYAVAVVFMPDFLGQLALLAFHEATPAAAHGSTAQLVVSVAYVLFMQLYFVMLRFVVRAMSAPHAFTRFLFVVRALPGPPASDASPQSPPRPLMLPPGPPLASGASVLLFLLVHHGRGQRGAAGRPLPRPAAAAQRQLRVRQHGPGQRRGRLGGARAPYGHRPARPPRPLHPGRGVSPPPQRLARRAPLRRRQ